VRRLCAVTLAAVHRRLTTHRMLAMALAAILGHSDGAGSFLEARQARPGEK
jgi:hypothetical protein